MKACELCGARLRPLRKRFCSTACSRKWHHGFDVPKKRKDGPIEGRSRPVATFPASG